MDTRPEGELKEKDFVHEEKTPPPISFWLLLVILIGVAGLFWLGASKLVYLVKTETTNKPFLQVTNREFSLFLWQNPEFMKGNYKEKTGYLPAFHAIHKVTPKAESADQYVAAPPEVLFRYHTWNRLVGSDYFPRPIMQKDFVEFLAYDDEWLPEYWKNAPQSYQNLVNELDKTKNADLSELPLEVKIAYTGWENNYHEEAEINQLTPTYEEVKTFVEAQPGYDRSHWRNIYPNYLKSLEKADPKSKVAAEEMPNFLKVALYNFKRRK